ncbi:MAG: N-acetylmuramoyl-L-alanine amidase [Clostridiales bacterium]|nr:N-acetylmuramoyl-L-alanine amidase [Clostridiales bacterium]
MNKSMETTAQKVDKREKPLVIVDAGHGGQDPGKIGVNDALEKDVNLSIAIYLKEYLEKRDVQVLMTREDGERLVNSQSGDLKERVKLINENSPDLTVSIHQNSYHEASVHGAQAFYFTHSKEAKTAAEIIQKAIKTADTEGSREAKANDTYYLLKKTEVPVVIMECGFLSNYEEAEKLVTEEYQKELAEAIADGVMEYLESR